MRLISIILLLVVQSCGSIESSPELRPYMDAYSKAAAERGLGLFYKAKPSFFVGRDTITCSGATTIGCCVRLNGISRVEIVKDYWDRATELEKLALMFHEQGHCAQGIRSHTEDGIMRAIVLREPELKNWDALVDSLFKLRRK